MNPGHVGGALIVLGLALTAGCRAVDPPSPPPASALWVAPGGAIDLEAQTHLVRAGVRELAVEAGELRWRGAAPQVSLTPWPRLPPAARATLVLREVDDPAEAPGGEAGARLRDEWLRLTKAAQGRGLVVEGLLLEPPPRTEFRALAERLRSWRRALPRTARLGVVVFRDRVADPDLRRVAGAVDYLAAFLYGVRPAAVDVPEAWDLAEVERQVRALESLEVPYLLGLSTVGWATHRRLDGSEVSHRTVAALAPLLAEPALERVPGMSLSAIDRQLYELRAERAVTVDGWRLAASDRLRVSRLSTPLVEEFLRRRGAWGARFDRGLLFWRSPLPGERFALPPSSLAAALDSQPATPRLELALERLSADRREWRLRVRLANLNDETSDVAEIDNNYVELRAAGARFVDADPGGFRRLELRRGAERNTVRAMREADGLRLGLPILEGRAEVMSGPVVVRLLSLEPAIEIGASFLLADGRSLVLPPRPWEFVP